MSKCIYTYTFFFTKTCVKKNLTGFYHFFHGPGESAGRVLVDFLVKKDKKILGRGRVLGTAEAQYEMFSLLFLRDS